MSLIHLLSLLSAAFLAGLVSSTIDEPLAMNIPLELSPWTANAEFFIDDGFLGSDKDIVDAKSLIEEIQNHLKNGMEPSIRLKSTGLHYVRGYHTM